MLLDVLQYFCLFHFLLPHLRQKGSHALGNILCQNFFKVCLQVHNPILPVKISPAY